MVGGKQKVKAGMYSNNASEAQQNNIISALFQKLRKSDESQRASPIARQPPKQEQIGMLLAELRNEASSSNNKGNEMTGGIGWAATRKPNNPNKKMPPNPTTSQLPDAPRNAGGI